MSNRINIGIIQVNKISTLIESIRQAIMKYLVILFIAIVGIGTTSASGTKDLCALKSLNPLLYGISTILDQTLRGLFETVTRLLYTILNGLVGLIEKLVPEGTTIELDDLKEIIEELTNPNILSVLTAVLDSLDINATIVLKLMPGCIGHASVNLSVLLNILTGLAPDPEIPMCEFFKAIVAYIIEIYAPRF